MSDEIKCPKCASTQLSANKKGFSGRKAVAGAVLTGGIGLLAGTIGSNNIIITCLSCGHQFKPGEKAKPVQPVTPKSLKTGSIVGLIFGILFLVLGLVVLFSEGYVLGIIMLLIGAFGIGMYISNKKLATQMEQDTMQP